MLGAKARPPKHKQKGKNASKKTQAHKRQCSVDWRPSLLKWLCSSISLLAGHTLGTLVMSNLLSRTMWLHCA